MTKLKSKSFLTFLILPLFFSGSFFQAAICRDKIPPAFTLEFWSVYDESKIYQPLIAAFQAKYPFITINYTKKAYDDYEEDLIDSLAAGRGPDIFSINNAWLPRYLDKLSPAPTASKDVPASVVTRQQVAGLFVDAVSSDFVYKDQVYALPLAVDSLALFYNKDFFNSAGIAQAPKTWAEFSEDVKNLTQRDRTSREITRAGAAIGTAENINRSTDILGLLMMQSGAKMVNSAKTTAAFGDTAALANGNIFNPGEGALLFYTSFADPNKNFYTWNRIQHYSLDAFIEGKTAMMISYSYQIPVLRARAPHLNFGIAAVPQVSLENTAVSYANYWGNAVSKKSQYADYAWVFINFISDSENAKKYLEQAQKPAARRDLIDWQKGDMDLGIFAQQSLIAKSWWQVDSSKIESIFSDMIESVVAKRADVSEAVRNASQQVTVLIQKYNTK